MEQNRLSKFFGALTVLSAGLALLAFSGNKHFSPRSDAAPAIYEPADPQAYSAIYALSDVHGMFSEALKALSTAGITDSSGNWTAGNALLVIVGDSIDKGPDSIGVIDLWRALAPQARAVGGNVVHLLGNHEAELLADPSGNLSSVLARELQAKNLTLNDLVDPSTPRGAYLHDEPLAAKIGNWLFCHAGLYPSLSWAEFKAKATQALGTGNYGDSFILGSDSILEAKNWWKKKSVRKELLARLARNGFIGMVQGHQPGAYNIKDKIGAIEAGHFVRVDCGVSPPAGSNPIQILEFPHPAQLLSAQIPEMLVLSDDGSSAPLRITQLSGDVTPQYPDDD